MCNLSWTPPNLPPPTCNKPHTLRDAVTDKNRNRNIIWREGGREGSREGGIEGGRVDSYVIQWVGEWVGGSVCE